MKLLVIVVATVAAALAAGVFLPRSPNFEDPDLANIIRVTPNKYFASGCWASRLYYWGGIFRSGVFRGTVSWQFTDAVGTVGGPAYPTYMSWFYVPPLSVETLGGSNDPNFTFGVATRAGSMSADFGMRTGADPSRIAGIVQGALITGYDEVGDPTGYTNTSQYTATAYRPSLGWPNC